MNDIQYGFYDRLHASFPSQILMDISEICNLSCIHCPHPNFAKSEHYAKRNIDPDLNEKMVEEVKLHGQGITQYIRYASNGEPLVHPNAYDMLDLAVKYSGVFVTLTTNGKIMNEKRIQKLLESGIHLIDISLDAFTNETYSKIRVGGDLNVTRANVLHLLKWVKEAKLKTKIVVSFVEQPLNTAETKDFEQFWQAQGVDFVVIRRLHSHCGAKTDIATEKHNELKESKRRPCLYPWERIVVNARGDLAFCPSDWVHGSYIGDYKKTTIKETWNGEFYRALRQAHIDNHYKNHKFCGQCPDWSATRWPGEGRSYANMVEDFLEVENNR